jgi:hypothetical protein
MTLRDGPRFDGLDPDTEYVASVLLMGIQLVYLQHFAPFLTAMIA